MSAKGKGANKSKDCSKVNPGVTKVTIWAESTLEYKNSAVKDGPECLDRYVAADIFHRDAKGDVMRMFTMGKLPPSIDGGPVEVQMFGTVPPPAVRRVVKNSKGKARAQDGTESDEEEQDVPGDGGDTTPRARGMTPPRYSRGGSPAAGGSYSRAPSLVPASRGGRLKIQDKRRRQDEEGESMAAGGMSLRSRNGSPSYNDASGMTDDEIVEQERGLLMNWFERTKHSYLNRPDMLDLIVKRYIEDQNKVFIDESKIPTAGYGLFAVDIIEPGIVVAILGTTLLLKELHNQMVQMCDGVPWNVQNPLICAGGMANSCGDAKDKQNASIFTFVFHGLGGQERICFIMAVRKIEKREEILLDYPVKLVPATLFTLSKEQPQPEPESISRGEYDRRSVSRATSQAPQDAAQSVSDTD